MNSLAHMGHVWSVIQFCRIAHFGNLGKRLNEARSHLNASYVSGPLADEGALGRGAGCRRGSCASPARRASLVWAAQASDHCNRRLAYSRSKRLTCVWMNRPCAKTETPVQLHSHQPPCAGIRSLRLPFRTRFSGPTLLVSLVEVVSQCGRRTHQ